MTELRIGDGFEQLGHRLLELAERSAAVQERIERAAQQAGACWGQDDPGKQFADSYLPDAEKVSAMTQNLIEQLRSYGSNVVAAAQNLAAQDASSGAALGGTQGGNPALEPANGTPIANQNSAQPASSSPSQHGTATPSNNSAATPKQASPGQTSQTPNPSAPSQSPPTQPTPNRETGSPRDRSNPARPAQTPSSAPQSRPSNPARARVTSTRPTNGREAPSVTPPGGPAGGSRPGQQPATPANRATTSQDPGPAPARPGPPQAQNKQKQEEKPREKPDKGAGKSKKRLWEKLPKRYGIEVSGFDIPGADQSALQEIAEAVDSILGSYPFVSFRRLAIARLSEGEWTRVSWVRDEQGAAVADEVTLAASMVTDPEDFAGRVADAVSQGFVTKASRRRPVFAAVVRALGSVVDVAGGFAGRQVAQRELVSAYVGTARSESMGQVVGGFREWRSRLSTCCFHDGSFNPGPALAEGFTERELLQDNCGQAARVLHTVLLDAARNKAGDSIRTESAP